MSKAFTKETDGEEEVDLPEIATDNVKNYVTPLGFSELQQELLALATVERPNIVEIVRWAAGNGDRSENGDYIYGKKRLREIDRRIRYLTKRIKTADIIDPKKQQGLDRIYFGATVTYLRADNSQNIIKLVGIDEADLSKGKISWNSPVAKAMIKSKINDEIQIRAPAGVEKIRIIKIEYEV